MIKKKCIVVGDQIEGEDGAPVYLDALEICKRLGVNPNEAVLVDHRGPSHRHIIQKYPDLPVLGPKDLKP